ncbi:unnamed protein product [Malus baccata var. baccata]
MEEQQEHEVYGAEIPNDDGEDVDMSSRADGVDDDQDYNDDPNSKELEDMKKRLKEIEEEAGALRDMQAKVEKEMGAVQDSSGGSASQAEKEEVDYACTPEEVQQHFQSCGTVNRVTILTDKFGQPKGFAYVEFVEVEAVQNALLLNESELHGRQLKVSAKRTNVPGLKQYRGRRPSPFSRSRRPFIPAAPFYPGFGYGADDAAYTEGNDIAAVGDGGEDVEFVAVGAPADILVDSKPAEKKRAPMSMRLHSWLANVLALWAYILYVNFTSIMYTIHSSSTRVEGGQYNSLRSEHKCIFFLLTMLGVLLQVKHATGDTPSPFVTDHNTIVMLIADLFTYAGALATVNIFQASNNTEIYELMNNLSLLCGTLALILMMLILIPTFGWFTLACWVIYFAIIVTKSYETLKRLGNAAVRYVRHKMKAGVRHVCDRMKAGVRYVCDRIKAAFRYVRDKMKELMIISKGTEEPQNQNGML